MVLTARIPFTFAASFALWVQPAGPAAPPRFASYPAKVEQIRKIPQLRLTTSQVRRYRTELREASNHPPDFAGHYILANWGCGASCVLAAAIDAKTGAVTLFPFTVSNWPLDVTEPLTYKQDSRLLLVQGSRNEKGSGTAAYEFTGHSFRPLTPDPPSR